MEKKLKRGLVYLTLIFMLLSIINISAQSRFKGTDIQLYMENVGNIIGDILSPIIGPAATGEFLFAKVLLFFLLFAIIFMASEKVRILEENRAVHIIVAVIVTIFAVRYIKPNEFVNAILLPYGALGVAISIFLPLIIFFFFVHHSIDGGFGRRAAWFIYFISFVFLWGSREYDSLGTANWLYILGFGFALINLIFDKSIHKYFRGMEIESSAKPFKQVGRIKLKNEMKEVNEAYNDGIISKGEHDSAIRNLKKRYKNI